MHKTFKWLMALGIGLLAGGADAAAASFDLRTPKAPAARLLAAPAPAGSCLKSAALPAGAATAGALAVGDELTFLLFEGTEIRVTLSERMESPLGGEAFLGTVSGYAGVKNAVVLQTADGLTVDIQDFARNRAYTIVSDASGVTVREIDPSAAAVTPTAPIDSGLPQGRSAPRLLSSPLDTAQPDQPTTLVDILVAYDTPSAAWVRQNGGGITNFATMAVQKMNTVLDNSGFASSFRYRLVGVMTVDANGGNDFTNVLESVRHGRGDWASVKAKRNEVGADIVTTLIDTGSAEGSNGLSYSLNRSYVDFSAFSESAYNVCAVRAVAQSHVMTHEVGHNLGAGHATAVADAENRGPLLYDYSAGYYFTGTDGVAYHTIMAYNSDGYGNHYKSAPFFSSPNFTYMGTAVGDDMHDNVRTIQQTYRAASRWRSQVVPMSYDVFFSPEAGSLFTDSITVALTPGKQGTEIRYTLDGSTPTVSSTLYVRPVTFTQTTTIRAITVTDGVAGPVFEATYSVSDIGTATDAPQLTWRTSESNPWTFQTDDTYDGIGAVQSQDDGGYWTNESWLETNVTGPTRMSFRYKTRKYNGTFSVLVDGTAVLTDTKDTTADVWTLQEIDVPAGTHAIRFLFHSWIEDDDGKHSGRYEGFNGAWLDTVQFDALSRPPTISPATTGDESSATTFQGNLTVTLSPPAGRTGFLYYTLDGSDPTGEAQILYEDPIALTKSTRVRAVFVEGGKEPSVEVEGLYLERHPVSPGEWTTDVDGVKTAAARNGRLIAVMLADRAGSRYSQRFYPVAESPEFLAWAKANGIYLVTGDVSCNADAQTANRWFWSLCDLTRVSTPAMYFVRPDTPDNPIGQGIACNDGSSRVGTELYLDSAESLIAGFASVLGETVPQAPTCSLTEPLVESFPVYVTLTHQNTAGDIYYTLDGSVPTPANGTLYRYGTTIPIAKTSRLTAMVWPSSGGLSSGAYVSKFKAVGDVLGTSDAIWSLSNAGSWREGDEAGTLRAGGLQSAPYATTLQATVTGQGLLVFTYAFNSWTSANSFTFKVNGQPEFSHAYDGVSKFYSGTVTNEVFSTAATTYTWTYTVGDASRDYGQGYSPQAGIWLSNVQWIPTSQEPSTFAFAKENVSVTEGGTAAIRVRGGSKAEATSVTAYLTYNTAVAADVDLGQVKFPLTLTWAKNEIGEKVISIPAKADKAVENDEFFTLQLAEAQGLELGDDCVCTVTVHDPGYDALAQKIRTGSASASEQAAWNKLQAAANAPYIRGLASPANGGKVTGSGPCANGKSVTLKAAANKGYVFNGWYDADGNLLTQAAAYSVAAPDGHDVERTARFVTVDEDRRNISLEVNGFAMPDAPTAPTTWTSICGVAVNWPVTSSGLSATTVKAAGLPSGLKLVQDKATKAYAVSGAPTAASKVNAKTGETTPSKVVFTVTTAGKSTKTFAIDLYVHPLPAWAVGTFNGPVHGNGTATLAVTAAGKISGKAMVGGTNWTFKADAISAVSCNMSDATSGNVATNFILDAVATAGKATCPLTLSLAAFTYAPLPASATSCAAGTFGRDKAALYRVIWTDKADSRAASLIAAYAGAYSFAAACGERMGNVTFTLDEKGGVKGSVILPGGAKAQTTAFSANALVESDGIHLAFAVPPDAKKGLPCVFEDRVLVAQSGDSAPGYAFRDPGVVAETAPLYAGSTASGTVAVAPKYGQVAPGKSVTLKATAAKGSVFAGWYDGTVLLSQTASFALPAPTGDKTITARFVTAEEDKRYISLEVNGVVMSSATTASTAWTSICGVAVNWPVASSGLSATTVKAAGLPSGLKLVQDKVTGSYSVTGVPTAASKAGKEGVVTPSKVVFTVTTAGKSTKTFAIDLYIEALPAWAVGTFDGLAVSQNGIVQAMTISSAGKISGKLLVNGTTWTLAASSFDDRSDAGFTATVIGKAGKEVMTNKVTIAAREAGLAADRAPYQIGVASGRSVRPSSTTTVTTFVPMDWIAWQNPWKSADMKDEMPVFTKNIDKTLEYGNAGDANNSLKLTFKKNGVVAFAGMVGGTKVSGSSQLVLTETGWQVTIYAPPKTSFTGYCETLSVTLKSAGQNIVDEVDVHSRNETSGASSL